jgi:phage/plasmid-associated DNA primase
MLSIEKPAGSIFVNGMKSREYPNHGLVYGFIKEGMGIKLRKHETKTYGDEQTLYKKYIKNTVISNGEKYIDVEYILPKHGWGRVKALDALTGSGFHRPTRHSFFCDNYIDFDIENAQPCILLQKAIQCGINTFGLKEYCDNPKKARAEIVAHYQLRDFIDRDGVIITAMEQAKKLPITLCFGGSADKWRDDYRVNASIYPMPMVVGIENCVSELGAMIIEQNPHIMEDMEKFKEDFDTKTDNAKGRSVVAIYSQTVERVIQEHCVALLVRKHPSVKLRDVVPCQDGFMPLKKQIAGVDIPKLFEDFMKSVQDVYGLTLTWKVKEFDEAIDIPFCAVMPVNITLEDLARGERRLVDIIAPSLFDVMKYVETDKSWYNITENKLWAKSSRPNEYSITSIIQDAIDEERLRITMLKPLNKDAIEERENNLKLLGKAYRECGKMGSSKQVANFLRDVLRDDDFPKLLDKNPYKIAFKNGMYDLKTGIFTRGFEIKDYLTATVPFDWSEPTNTDIEIVRNELKKITNWNEEHLQYYLSALGYALTGDSKMEQAFWYFRGQTACNGKSVVFEAIEELLPIYVCKSSPDTFDKGVDNKKEVATWAGMRIVWVNELSKKKKDADLLKSIGDGTNYKYKRNYAIQSEVVDIMFKLFCVSNHSLNINADAGIMRRFRMGQFDSQFVEGLPEDNYESLQFKMDKTFGKKLTGEYKYALLKLLFKYSQEYYQEGKLKPYPSEWKGEADEVMEDNNPFDILMREKFVFDSEGMISKKRFEEMLPEPFKSLRFKDEFKRMRCTVQYDPHKRFGGDRGFWLGIREKDEREEEGVEGDVKQP